jgi:TPR repeat protein
MRILTLILCLLSVNAFAEVTPEEFKKTKELAEKGDAVAQYNLAVLYTDGDGVLKDAVEGVKWFRKSAEQGLAEAQYNLGVCYRDGVGVLKDPVEAVKCYRKAAEQGLAIAQHILGLCYYNGEGVSKDPVEAVKWFRKSAEQGNARAQSQLGFNYTKGLGVLKDPAEGFKWYRKAAEQGDAIAQFNLGSSYYNGEGVLKDLVEAVKWFRKSAEQGFAPAQNNLGNLYYYVEGVLKDPIEAYAFYNLAGITLEKARKKLDILEKEMTPSQIEAGKKRSKELQTKILADKGDAIAQYNLGKFYSSKGIMAFPEIVEAVKWFRKSAEQGYAKAQCELGVSYYHGWGVEISDVEAEKWLRLSSLQGIKKAQSFLAECYQNGGSGLGEGVPINVIESYAFYDIAGEFESLNLLKKQITPSQIAAGQKRSMELLALIEANKKANTK